MKIPDPLKPNSLPKIMFMGALGTLITLLVTAAWKPMDHSYNVPHVNAESYDMRQREQERAINANRESLTRSETRTDQVFSELRDIKNGVNEINNYLRTYRYGSQVPDDLQQVTP